VQSVEHLQTSYKKLLAIDRWGTFQLPKARKHKIKEYPTGSTNGMKMATGDYGVCTLYVVCKRVESKVMALFMKDMQHPRMALKQLFSFCRMRGASCRR
jgi:hypothetical protein